MSDNQRFLTGWSYEAKPRHKIFCDTCKYLFTVVTHTKEGLKFSDIYESCAHGASENVNYILNHSNEPGNYHSGIELKGLIAHYIAQSCGWFTKEV